MTAFDLAPLNRSTIGFDRMLDLLQRASEVQLVDNYPPYNIEKAGEDQYRITLAVAGFTPEELNVVSQQNQLLVQGRKKEEDGQTFLYHGIANRSFQRRFELADHVKVTGAAITDGLLVIDLVREVPEEMRPRRIEITAGGTARQIEKKAA